MLVYNDRTYCDREDCSNWDGCDRALTQEVVKKAIIWWGSGTYEEDGKGPPIAVLMDDPECYKV